MKFIIIYNRRHKQTVTRGLFSSPLSSGEDGLQWHLFREVPRVKGPGGDGDRCEHYRELMLQLGPSNR